MTMIRVTETRRAISWLTALAIYPTGGESWSTHCDQMRRSYFATVESRKLSDWHDVILPNWASPEDFSMDDNLMMHLIHYDVVRLGRSFPLLSPGSNMTDRQCQLLCRRLERILYVIGSTYHTLKYVQGFNELLMPIYYIFMNAPELFPTDDALEATAFHALHTLISGTALVELFAIQDDSSTLLHNLNQFEDLMRTYLPLSHRIVRALKLHPACYCFKWFSLMFAQEHELGQLVELWDVLFEHLDDLLEYLYLVGLGHVAQMENRLNPKNFSQSIHVLQNASDCDLPRAMEYAEILSKRRKPVEGYGWMAPVCLCASSLLLSLVWN
jgi:hypothetical protein